MTFRWKAKRNETIARRAGGKAAMAHFHAIGKNNKGITILHYQNATRLLQEIAERDLNQRQHFALAEMEKLSLLAKSKKHYHHGGNIWHDFQRLSHILNSIVPNSHWSFPVIREIAKDFPNTKGIKVFAFEAGYGIPLIFLKKYFNATVCGTDSGKHSKVFTKEHGLDIFHSPDWTEKFIAGLGIQDVTFSIGAIEQKTGKEEVKEMLKQLKTAAKITRKGGYSYMVLSEGMPVKIVEKETDRTATASHILPISRQQMESNGFKLLKWERNSHMVFIKLQKVTD